MSPAREDSTNAMAKKEEHDIGEERQAQQVQLADVAARTGSPHEPQVPAPVEPRRDPVPHVGRDHGHAGAWSIGVHELQVGVCDAPAPGRPVRGQRVADPGPGGAPRGHHRALQQAALESPVRPEGGPERDQPVPRNQPAALGILQLVQRLDLGREGHVISEPGGSKFV
jgi:hypothetical protein